ncbi:MAG TPA: polyprenyl synthetase family protein [Gaiellaceae bacterium]
MTSALATIRETPGLDEYLEELEERLDETVASHEGVVAAVSRDALHAGGKRLRPLLVFFSTPPGASPSVAAGVAVELVHMATLVHDDLIDGAEFRRGRASAWSAYGPAAARATGDFLFARAFAELAATGDPRAVSLLAEAALSLARGEAMQRRQANDPDTTVEAYLARCSLKTGKLFEAACVLGAGRHELGAFGLALGIAFQITDDILDCAGETVETGKIAGVDLREGTPTLPLILAAREDEVVRRALAGGPQEGALVRVAATGALDRSRELALDYARRARACLNGELHREELETLTHLVVHRES